MSYQSMLYSELSYTLIACLRLRSVISIHAVFRAFLFSHCMFSGSGVSYQTMLYSELSYTLITCSQAQECHINPCCIQSVPTLSPVLFMPSKQCCWIALSFFSHCSGFPLSPPHCYLLNSLLLFLHFSYYFGCFVLALLVSQLECWLFHLLNWSAGSSSFSTGVLALPASQLECWLF